MAIYRNYESPLGQISNDFRERNQNNYGASSWGAQQTSDTTYNRFVGFGGTVVDPTGLNIQTPEQLIQQSTQDDPWKNPFHDYWISDTNDPNQTNSLLDIIYAAIDPVDRPKMGGMLKEYYYRVFKNPIQTGNFYKFIMNNLTSMGETADVLATFIKAVMPESMTTAKTVSPGSTVGERLRNVTGFGQAGRYSYDYNVNWFKPDGSGLGNALSNMALEVVGDPLNWLEWGAKAITKAGSSAMGDMIRASAKQAGVDEASKLYKGIDKLATEQAWNLTKAFYGLDGTNIAKQQDTFRAMANQLWKNVGNADLDTKIQTLTQGIFKSYDELLDTAHSFNPENLRAYKQLQEKTNKSVEELFKHTSDPVEIAKWFTENKDFQKEILEATITYDTLKSNFVDIINHSTKSGAARVNGDILRSLDTWGKVARGADTLNRRIMQVAGMPFFTPVVHLTKNLGTPAVQYLSNSLARAYTDPKMQAKSSVEIKEKLIQLSVDIAKGIEELDEKGLTKEVEEWTNNLLTLDFSKRIDDLYDYIETYAKRYEIDIDQTFSAMSSNRWMTFESFYNELKNNDDLWAAMEDSTKGKLTAMLEMVERNKNTQVLTKEFDDYDTILKQVNTEDIDTVHISSREFYDKFDDILDHIDEIDFGENIERQLDRLAKDTQSIDSALDFYGKYMWHNYKYEMWKETVEGVLKNIDDVTDDELDALKDLLKGLKREMDIFRQLKDVDMIHLYKLIMDDVGWNGDWSATLMRLWEKIEPSLKRSTGDDLTEWYSFVRKFKEGGFNGTKNSTAGLADLLEFNEWWGNWKCITDSTYDKLSKQVKNIDADLAAKTLRGAEDKGLFDDLVDRVITAYEVKKSDKPYETLYTMTDDIREYIGAELQKIDTSNGLAKELYDHWRELDDLKEYGEIDLARITELEYEDDLDFIYRFEEKIGSPTEYDEEDYQAVMDILSNAKRMIREQEQAIKYAAVSTEDKGRIIKTMMGREHSTEELINGPFYDHAKAILSGDTNGAFAILFDAVGQKSVADALGTDLVDAANELKAQLTKIVYYHYMDQDLASRLAKYGEEGALLQKQVQDALESFYNVALEKFADESSGNYYRHAFLEKCQELLINKFRTERVSLDYQRQLVARGELPELAEYCEQFGYDLQKALEGHDATNDSIMTELVLRHYCPELAKELDAKAALGMNTLVWDLETVGTNPHGTEARILQIGYRPWGAKEGTSLDVKLPITEYNPYTAPSDEVICKLLHIEEGTQSHAQLLEAYRTKYFTSNLNEVTTEKDVIEAFHNLVPDYDSILGMNTDKFDVNYFYTRAGYVHPERMDNVKRYQQQGKSIDLMHEMYKAQGVPYMSDEIYLEINDWLKRWGTWADADVSIRSCRPWEIKQSIKETQNHLKLISKDAQKQIGDDVMFMLDQLEQLSKDVDDWLVTHGNRALANDVTQYIQDFTEGLSVDEIYERLRELVSPGMDPLDFRKAWLEWNGGRDPENLYNILKGNEHNPLFSYKVVWKPEYEKYIARGDIISTREMETITNHIKWALKKAETIQNVNSYVGQFGPWKTWEEAHNYLAKIVQIPPETGRFWWYKDLNVDNITHQEILGFIYSIEASAPVKTMRNAVDASGLVEGLLQQEEMLIETEQDLLKAMNESLKEFKKQCGPYEEGEYEWIEELYMFLHPAKETIAKAEKVAVAAQTTPKTFSLGEYAIRTTDSVDKYIREVDDAVDTLQKITAFLNMDVAGPKQYAVMEATASLNNAITAIQKWWATDPEGATMELNKLIGDLESVKQVIAQRFRNPEILRSYLFTCSPYFRVPEKYLLWFQDADYIKQLNELGIGIKFKKTNTGYGNSALVYLKKGAFESFEKVDGEDLYRLKYLDGRTAMITPYDIELPRLIDYEDDSEIYKGLKTQFRQVFDKYKEFGGRTIDLYSKGVVSNSYMNEVMRTNLDFIGVNDLGKVGLSYSTNLTNPLRPFEITDLFQNAYHSISNAAASCKNEIIYKDLFYNQDFGMHLATGFMSKFSDEEIAKAFSNSDGTVVVTALVQNNLNALDVAYWKARGVDVQPYKAIQIPIHTANDVKMAKNLNAVMMPYDVYAKSFDVINNAKGVRPMYQDLARRLQFMYKLGYLSSVGTWMRNAMDSPLKTMVQTQNGPVSTVSSIQSGMKSYQAYHTFLDELVKREGKDVVVSTKSIRDLWAKLAGEAGQDFHKFKYHGLTYTELKRIKGFIDYGASGTQTAELMQSITKNVQTGWFDKLTETMLSPMSGIETAVRMGQFDLMSRQGASRLQVFKGVSDAQFDYNMMSDAASALSTFIPFFNFQWKNFEFWLNALYEHPQYLAYLDNYMNASGDSFGLERDELFNNRGVMYQVTHGNFAIKGFDGATLNFKVNPSLFDAFNILVEPANVATAIGHAGMGFSPESSVYQWYENNSLLGSLWAPYQTIIDTVADPYLNQANDVAMNIGIYKGQPMSKVLADQKYCQQIVDNQYLSDECRRIIQESLNGTSRLITFGKYSATEVTTLMKEHPDYCQYMMAQDWFREAYPELVDIFDYNGLNTYDTYQMPWGKYAGLPLSEVPKDYVDWFLKQDWASSWDILYNYWANGITEPAPNWTRQTVCDTSELLGKLCYDVASDNQESLNEFWEAFFKNEKSNLTQNIPVGGNLIQKNATAVTNWERLSNVSNTAAVLGTFLPSAFGSTLLYQNRAVAYNTYTTENVNTERHDEKYNRYATAREWHRRLAKKLGQEY